MSTNNKCHVCGKTVYPMDRLSVNDTLFHKRCFKCEKCQMSLGMGNYACLEGHFFCKPHYQQMFKEKGNYDEGFGRQQHKNQWKQETFGTSARQDFNKPVKKEEEPAKKDEPAKAEEPVKKEEPVKSDPVKEEVPRGSMQDAKKAFEAKPAEEKPQPSSAPKKVVKVGGGSDANKCHVCGKTVYTMDRFSVNDTLFHKRCFKCEKCQMSLGMGNYACLEGHFFCKPHYQQMFKEKGNYDEGFGRQQHKNQWKQETFGTTARQDFNKPIKKEEPKAEEPKAEEPKAEEPKEEEPKAEEPKEEEPKEEEPKEEEPKEEEPKEEEPKEEEPKEEEPAAEEPKEEEPKEEEPAAEEPKEEEPAAEEPKEEEPAAEEPKEEEPAAEESQ